MTKRSTVATLLPLLFILLSNQSFARPLIVVGEEFAPFEFVQNGEVVGIDIDIAKHIFSQMGITPKFKILPWKRAWSDVEQGKADAVLTTSRKSSREPHVWYPKENMWVSEFVFFYNTHKKLADFSGYQSAKDNKLTIGIVRGNSYHSSFWQAFPYTDKSTEFKGDLSNEKQLNKQLNNTTTFKQNINKLNANRVDLVIADKTYGTYTAKLEGLSKNISYYDTTLYSKGYPMPFAKHSDYPNIENIAKEFENKLIQMKANGEYQKIMNHWLK